MMCTKCGVKLRQVTEIDWICPSCNTEYLIIGGENDRKE